MKKNLFILLFLLILPACSIISLFIRSYTPSWFKNPVPREPPGSMSFTEAIKTWEGASMEELTAVWGKHSRITPDPDSHYKAYWWRWNYGDLTKNYPELCDQN
jgi:hypothetical protein